MSRRLAMAAIVLLAGCASTDPSPAVESVVPSGSALDCGEIASDTCRAVADAAGLMLGTAPRAVETMELPDEEDGLQVVERYLVTLEPDAAGDELVEVVRFAGSDNWSVRRLPTPSGDA